MECWVEQDGQPAGERRGAYQGRSWGSVDWVVYP